MLSRRSGRMTRSAPRSKVMKRRFQTRSEGDTSSDVWEFSTSAAKVRRASFYGLAEGYESTLFDLLGEQRASGNFCGRKSRGADEKKWNEGVPERLVRVLDVRRLFIPDDKASRACEEFNLQSLKALNSERFRLGGVVFMAIFTEGISGELRRHSGDNRLWRCQRGTSAIDPVTLELSVLFHPDRPKAYRWPSALQVKLGDVTSYAENCQFADFVKARRSWSEKIGVGPREISACAYGYVLRQLKYPDSDKDLLMNLLTGIQAVFQNA